MSNHIKDPHLRPIGVIALTAQFRDTLKGREQALFDDLQAILRNYGYNDDQAVTAFKTLTEGGDQ